MLHRITEAPKHFSRYEAFVTFASLLFSLCFIPAILLLVFHYFDRKGTHDQLKGCKRLGLKARSNLADEHDKRYLMGGKDRKDTEGSCKVKSLWIYPIKSCRGIELQSSDILNVGLQFDRTYSFAQLKSPFPVSLETPETEKANHHWKFITQRNFPLLAQIKTEIWVPDPASPKYSAKHPNVQAGGVLVIRYPYGSDGFRGIIERIWAALGGEPPHKSVHLPLNPSAEQIHQSGYTLEQMEIWKDSPMSLNMGNTIGAGSKLYLEELQAHLGCTNPLALFRVSETHYRDVFRCAPRQEQLGWQPQVGFGDAYPLHILNLASVRDVGSKVQKGAPRLSALQFRPNIIFTGAEPYDEDQWKRIRIGDYEYHVPCRTVRCLLPNVDQRTGLRDKVEPNKALKSFRCVDEGAVGKACLGMQMVCATKQAKIQVGDPITVLETGEHRYIPQ